MKKMFITGVSGLLGSNLAFAYRDRYQTTGLYHTHPVTIKGVLTLAGDITQKEKIAGILHQCQPDIIIHCAAMSRPDQCQADQAGAYQTNVAGTQNILEAISQTEAKFVYISTDAIFDGLKGQYQTEEQGGPPHYYGHTKLQAEQESLLRSGTLVARINIYGWNIIDQQSFGEHIIHDLSQGRPMKGITDSFFSTIYTFKLARLIKEALEKDLQGIYHFVSCDACSKYEFIHKVAERFGLKTATVSPVTLDEFGFRAQRGRKLSLDVSKTEQALGHRLPTIEESIEAFYQDYQKGIPAALKACIHNCLTDGITLEGV